MYRALVRRDPSYEGLFFAGVKTTGIFCRPTCRARKPERKNVEFFQTTDEALQRGFRPCKVCRPMSLAEETPEWLQSLLEEVDENSGFRRFIHTYQLLTPLGPMIAASVDQGICLLEFKDRRMLERELKEIQERFHAPLVISKSPPIQELEKQLKEYFSGERKNFDLPLCTPGTKFQNTVWDALKKIPYGETKSYKTQATLMGKPKAVRAVARANGENRIAIVIPCHRVIGADGNLTGYGGGIERKKFLLHLERRHLPR